MGSPKKEEPLGLGAAGSRSGPQQLPAAQHFPVSSHSSLQGGPSLFPTASQTPLSRVWGARVVTRRGGVGSQGPPPCHERGQPHVAPGFPPLVHLAAPVTEEPCRWRRSWGASGWWSPCCPALWTGGHGGKRTISVESLKPCFQALSEKAAVCALRTSPQS